MSKVYKQFNSIDGIAGSAFGGGGGGGGGGGAPSKKKNNEQVYIGGHVGYVGKKSTSDERNTAHYIYNTLNPWLKLLMGVPVSSPEIA